MKVHLPYQNKSAYREIDIINNLNRVVLKVIQRQAKIKSDPTSDFQLKLKCFTVTFLQHFEN